MTARPGFTHDRPSPSVLAQFIAMWRALPPAVKRFASDLSAVVAIETRETTTRYRWAAAGVAAAVILLIATWVLACAAAALWASSALGWPREAAIAGVALANLLIALIAAFAAYRAVKRPAYPVALPELQRLRSFRSPDTHPGADEAFVAAGSRKEALVRSNAELQTRIVLAKQTTARLIRTKEAVAGALVLGALVGFATAGRRKRAAKDQGGAAKSPRLVRSITGQAVALVASAALNQLQRQWTRSRRAQ